MISIFRYLSNLSLRGTKQYRRQGTHPVVKAQLRERRANARNDKLVIWVCFLLFFPLFTSAQFVYDNRVYQPNIKTVEFCNTALEGSFPVITLGSAEQLLLGFDDLSTSSKSYSYTVEHCDADWNASRLSPVEYLQSFTEDRILDYRNSISTIQKYVHYELRLPNRNIIPKLPGNYLLKVFEDGDQNKPVLTRRFYVVNQRSAIAPQFTVSQNIASRETNQKLNFQIDISGLNVQNPYGDVRVLVMQNGRSETAQFNSRPTFVNGGLLVYNEISINDFPGYNEFRHIDTRSLRLNSERIQRIFRDTANTVLLLTDYNRNQPNYITAYDLNGGFSIRNQEGNDPRFDGDYAQTYFNLIPAASAAGWPVYLVGKFNDWQLSNASKMDYDDAKGRYYFNTALKQGVYDYQYVAVDPAGKPNYITYEGTHFETENDYQFLVYYRPPGARWEELVGFRQINTAGKR